MTTLEATVKEWIAARQHLFDLINDVEQGDKRAALTRLSNAEHALYGFYRGNR